MADGAIPVCGVETQLKDIAKKFLRGSAKKEGTALIMKIDRERGLIVLDEELDECSIEDIKDQLPDHQPRFFLYAFRHTHKDGRVAYPVVFVFNSPPGCQTETSVMYAASKNNLIRELDVGKSFEVRDVEELTQEWILNKLRIL